MPPRLNKRQQREQEELEALKVTLNEPEHEVVEDEEVLEAKRGGFGAAS